MLRQYVYRLNRVAHIRILSVCCRPCNRELPLYIGDAITLRLPQPLLHVSLHVHNLCALQVEEHMVDGKMKQLLVHRKGSTRAFPPHHPLIPVDYQLTGQPVLIGGTMGTNSYVLTGFFCLNLRSITMSCRADCSR